MESALFLCPSDAEAAKASTPFAANRSYGRELGRIFRPQGRRTTWNANALAGSAALKGYHSNLESFLATAQNPRAIVRCPAPRFVGKAEPAGRHLYSERSAKRLKLP